MTVRVAEVAWADQVERWSPTLTDHAVLVGSWPLLRGRVDVPRRVGALTDGWSGRARLGGDPLAVSVEQAEERSIVWTSTFGVDEWSVPFAANGPRLVVRHGRAVGGLVDEVVTTDRLTWRSVHDQGQSWREVTSSAEEVIAGWASATRRALARWGR